MSFLIPAWLLLLLPWLGLALLIFRSYRPRIVVPFLRLWPRDQVAQPQSRGWRVPPVPLLLVLLSLLLAIVALAGPAIIDRRGRLNHLTVLVDRGVTMLAGNRLQLAREQFLRILPQIARPEAAIDLVDTSGQHRLVSPASLAQALVGPATASDTRAQVAAAVDQQLQQDSGPLVLLGTVDSVVPSPHLLVITGGSTARNVGVVQASAAHGQILLTLRNESDLRQVDVFVSDTLRREPHTLELPPSGETRQYTLASGLKLPLRLHLELTDDLSDDNTFWILPECLTPRLQAGPDLPPAVARFISRYQTVRPAGPFSSGGTIATSAAPVDSSNRIIVSPGTRDIGTSDLKLTLDHPLLRQWRLPDHVLASTEALPTGNWQVLLQQGGITLLAVDDTHRRMWVGFSSPDWEQTPDFAIFWTNVVEYLAGQASATTFPEFLDHNWTRIEPTDPLAPEPNGLRQGLYRHGQDLLALNVPSPVLSRSTSEQSVEQWLAQFRQSEAGMPVTPYFWLAAGLIAGAGILLAGANKGT